MWCRKHLLPFGYNFFLFVSGTCNLHFSAFKEFPFTVLITLTGLERAFYTIKYECGIYFAGDRMFYTATICSREFRL